MKVYVAAPWSTRDAAIAVMHWLESQGHYVTSRWLRQLDDEGPMAAADDLADVTAADLLLALSPEAYRNIGTGGRHVELGYALALGKQIVLVGARTNVSHHLDCVRVIERVEEL